MGRKARWVKIMEEKQWKGRQGGKKMMVQRKCKEKEGRDRRERKRVKGRRN